LRAYNSYCSQPLGTSAVLAATAAKLISSSIGRGSSQNCEPTHGDAGNCPGVSASGQSRDRKRTLPWPLARHSHHAEGCLRHHRHCRDCGHAHSRESNSDATMVRRLAETVGVLLGKLQLTAGVFAKRHPRRSGAAMAAGTGFASLGSDTGGSIFFPVWLRLHQATLVREMRYEPRR